MLFEVAYPLANHRQPLGGTFFNPGLVPDDPEFGLNIWVVKLQTDEPLPGAGLEVFQDTLIARVVGDHQQKIWMGVE